MTTETPFKGYHKNLSSMPRSWVAVTPHDTNYLSGDASNNVAAMALYTSDGGDIAYYDGNGTLKSITLLPGATFPGEFTRVMATNTDATEIWAGFAEY